MANVDDAVTAGPVGGVPVTVAVSFNLPLSTSTWVTVYVAVHVMPAKAANVVDGQVMARDCPGSRARAARR